MMMKSSKKQKQQTETSKGIISSHMSTLHHRLHHALNLGFSRCNNHGNERRWNCEDIEIQRLAIRSISAFIDCVSSATVNHPLVKNSVSDILGALGGILRNKNRTILTVASNAVLKVVSILPSSLLQPDVLNLLHPLSSLLSFHQLEVAVSCATSLNAILSKLSKKTEKDVWTILQERKVVSVIIKSLLEFFDGSKQTEHFQEMTSLLSTIMMRWPPSRCLVWSNAKVMELLGVACEKPELSVKVTVLKLYSALALCSHGAKKLQENADSLLQVMLCCMDSSHPHSVRIVGLQLARQLARSEQGCLRMVSLGCDPIVRSIINAMRLPGLGSGKIANPAMSLLVEACRLALITRWGGNHHISFWNAGICRVLLDFLLADCQQMQQSQHLPLQEIICLVKEGLQVNLFLDLRPYIWEILGWLAAHSGEDFRPECHGDDFSVSTLIICACLAFLESSREGRHIHQTNITNTLSYEAVSRAVMMMIHSHCKYFSSKARFLLSEILRARGKEHLRYLIANLNLMSTNDQLMTLDLFQCTINLMGLACYLGLSQYRKHVIKHHGIKTLSVLMRWCLSNRAHVDRMNVSSQLYDTFDERVCCWVSNDWEGRDLLLLYCLLGLAELIYHSRFLNDDEDIFSRQLGCSESEFISQLREICIDSCTPGPRWYAAYILGFFDVYGFPSRFGERIGKALQEKQYTNLELILSNGESFKVHGVLLKVRCPALLPPEEFPSHEKVPNANVTKEANVNLCSKFKKVAHLSARVDHKELVKLLEFVYLGYFEAEQQLVKKLKSFARHCNLRLLVERLSRKAPKWGTPFPSCDLTLALDSAEENLWDVTVEAEATELLCWSCNICSLLNPHIHVHKVVLWASCDYLRALFQSGMQESHSQTIKVAISWKALLKLVTWFYSNEMPKPPSGCLWDSMETDEKLQELLPYIELCWLAEFWLLDDIRKEWLDMVISCLNTSKQIAVKIIKLAAKYSQWDLAEVAACHVAPSYRQLQASGELDELDEGLADLVRIASVRLAQQVRSFCFKQEPEDKLIRSLDTSSSSFCCVVFNSQYSTR